MQLPSLVAASFREYSENRYIPRISRDFLCFLALEGKADQFRPQPVSAPGKKGKSAIEEAATHADTISLTVECNERSDNNVQPVRVDESAGHGLP